MMFSDDDVSGYCLLSTSRISGSVPSTPLCIISLLISAPVLGLTPCYRWKLQDSEGVSHSLEIKSLIVSEPERKFGEKNIHFSKEWKYKAGNN